MSCVCCPLEILLKATLPTGGECRVTHPAAIPNIVIVAYVNMLTLETQLNFTAPQLCINIVVIYSNQLYMYKKRQSEVSCIFCKGYQIHTMIKVFIEFV